MSFTVTIGHSVTSGGKTISSVKANTASGRTSVNENVADSSTDFFINFAADVTAIKALYILSDQAVTVETNDGDSPDDTLALGANVPYVWQTGSLDDLALSTDVTALYVTNASGASANIQIEMIQDVTP